MEEEQKVETPVSKNPYKKFDTIIAFLGVELLCLVLFGFGGYLGLRLMQLFGILISFFAFYFLKDAVSGKTIKKSLLWLIPLAAFVLLGSFSLFNYSYYGGQSGLWVYLFYSILQFVSLLAFFLLGAGLRHITALKTRYVIYGLLGALGLLVAITLIYSLVRYGPFYAVKYKGMVYYFDGVSFPIDKEGKVLSGFSLLESSLLFASRPAFLLASSGVSLMALSPKKEKRLFIVIACLAFLGLLSLVLTPYLEGLIVLAGVYFLFGLLRLFEHLRKKHEKGIDIFYRVVFFVLIGIAVIGTVLLLTEDKTNLFTKLNLRRRGNIVDRFFTEVGDMLYNGNQNKPFLNIKSILFGFQPASNNGFATIHTDRVFEINVLCQCGLPCFLLLVYLFFYFLKKEKDYLHLSRDTFGERFFFLALLAAIFIHYSFFSDEMPLAHVDNQNFLFYMGSNGHYLLLALLGFTFIAPKAKEETHA